MAPPSCIPMASKASEGGVSSVTSELQKFSPFAPLEGASEQPCQVTEGLGGAMEARPFLPHHLCGAAGAVATPGPARAGPYYVPTTEFYTLNKDPSLESQDSSTLSSPPSDALAPPGAQGPPGSGTTPDPLFQFSIGKILEDEGASGAARVQGTDCELSGFYEGVTYAEGSDRGGPTPPQLQTPDRLEPDSLQADQRQIHR